LKSHKAIRLAAAGAAALLLLGCATACSQSVPIKGPLNFGDAGTQTVCTEAKPHQSIVLGEELENDTNQTLVISEVTGHGTVNVTTTDTAIMSTKLGGIATDVIPVQKDIRASWRSRQKPSGFVMKPGALVDVILVVKLRQGTRKGAVKAIAVDYTQRDGNQRYQNLGGRAFVLTPSKCGF
jgi:hypothetical protein